ncbi:MAG TPA: DUF4162 domain-containing protein, partial [Candidatus Bathyarchaeia archaeon]|nr:DUF4162 domain-containing protein [Candidatus Bathyarchaeia archaeon]
SDRVGILHRGKLLVCETPKKLKDSIPGGDIVEIQLEKEPPAQIIKELKGFKEVVDIVNIQPSSLRLYLNNVEEFVPRMMNMLVKKSVPIKSIHMTEPSLDDVFVHYTGLTIEEAQKGGE